MREILLYRGCTTPVRLPAYELATMNVLKELGVKAIPMKDVTCCGAQFVESLSPDAFAVIGGRILALAEDEEMDILTLCGACSGSLKITKHNLDNDPGLRRKVNDTLAEEGLKYTGKTRVLHLLQILAQEIGYDEIERHIVRPYNGLKIAAHYGCHVTRPFEIVQVDDPENPTIIDRLAEIAGAEAVDYPGKTRCCGGPMLAMDTTVATKIGQEKIFNVGLVGANVILTACEFCDLQLTQCQFDEAIKPSKRIPVMPITQFLGAAMGIDEERLGFEMNRISPDSVLEALQEGR